MLKTRVIPCLTVKGNRLVKSVRFADHRNIGNYVAAVRVFNARDVDELIFLDLDARKRGIQRWLIETVTKECFMPVTLGGGVSSLDDFQTMLSHGADKVAINTSAFTNPNLIDVASRRYGMQCVVVSIDVRKHDGTHEVYIEGGQTPTGKDAVSWAREAEARGAGEIFLTSIERDGVMEGYDLDLIESVSRSVRIPVIASGGAGVSMHCVEAVQSGASAIVAASMFQYTQVTPLAVKQTLASFGISARVL
jgi:cyclase